MEKDNKDVVLAKEKETGVPRKNSWGENGAFVVIGILLLVNLFIDNSRLELLYSAWLVYEVMRALNSLESGIKNKQRSDMILGIVEIIFAGLIAVLYFRNLV